MNNKLVFAGIIAAVGVGAYLLGRWQGDDTHAPAPAPAPTAGAPHTVQDFVHFAVGQNNVKALYLDGDAAWIGMSSGLVRYDGASGEHVIYNNANGLLSNGIFYVGKIRGEVWAGTYGGGLSVLDAKGQWRNYNIPHGMGDSFVYDVEEMANGDIWIATWSGANRVLGGRMDDVEAWELYTVENTSGGLPNDWVYGLARGRDGEIWMATEGGLARFKDGEWRNWTHGDGLGADYETVEAEQPFKNDPGQYSSHHARQKKEQGLGDIKVAYNPNYIVALTVDAEGRVWAGTWGGGLSRYDGEGWRTFTVNDGLPGNHVFALDTDNEGRVWIGTSQGLARYDGKTFTRYSTADGLYSNTIFAIATGPDGSAWIGSFGGATWFPNGIRDAAGG